MHAIKKGWDVPQRTKEAIVAHYALVVENSHDEREILEASKLLLAADRVDAMRERNAIEEGRPPSQPTSVVQINYNALSVEELLKLKELCEKAGLPDECDKEAEQGSDQQSTG